MKYSFVKINKYNLDLLKDFINSMGSSKKTFRYFDSRDAEICISNHKKSILLIQGKNPIGYGHLDRDKGDEKLWLGICLSEKYCGQGLGKNIMLELLKHNKEDIYLSVDSGNIAGQKLYSKFGFKITSSKASIVYMKKSYV